MFTSIEICAGAGGQALGLEKASFNHLACVEIDPQACETLRANRPDWTVIEQDLNQWSGAEFRGRVDLLAGGVPCPPFSKAGKQLGSEDERNLFPRALDLVDQIQPKAVMFENVRGLMDRVFDDFRASIDTRLRKLGFAVGWRLLNASDFGVSQLRPRVVLVAIRNELAGGFEWPAKSFERPLPVGALLLPLMAENGWSGAEAWAEQADAIAPTLVGGSRKHGGPDLGPTRARKAWASLGVEGRTIAEAAPEPGFAGMPRLTVRMGARVQGFPEDWVFTGSKTSMWRQVGNAFPPPVAHAVGLQILAALQAGAPAEEAGYLPGESGQEPLPIAV